ncbi:T9SS type A sorting domain-containing protein [Hymenobacter coccineus]|uniref:T9SS type A sorting domain-containing protein n=1 Tax=Hymenobacter coccineus TaxID=1908235 RepID=UPI0013012B93|nr:glycosyl hydrolase family 28-related protein [Hymenobacter coccineus]
MSDYNWLYLLKKVLDSVLFVFLIKHNMIIRTISRSVDFFHIFGLLLLLMGYASHKAQAQPVIIHASRTIQPGEAISLQGQFSAAAQVFLSIGTASSSQILPVLVQSAGHVTAQVPANLSPDLYQVWIMDQGKRSSTVYINQAHGLHFDSPEITPNGDGRLFGRNLLLTGGSPQIRLSPQDGGNSGGLAQVQVNDSYALRFTVPASLIPGKRYDVFVSNGLGGKLGETLVDQPLMAIAGGVDYFKLGVPWAAKLNFYSNIYNVRTDARLNQRAVGDGIGNDLPALQAAIDRASADGGGIVFLPAGTYKLALTAGGGIYMRNRVVLQGAGKDLTIIRFGYNSQAPGWSADGHWGLIWDNIKQGGLADLTLLNIDNSGNFYNNMTGRGTELFMQRIRFDLNLGSWLFWHKSSKLIISNSTFTQGVDAKAGYHGILQLEGCQDFIVSHNSFTYAVDGLSLNNTSRGIFEGNNVYRDGSARWPTSLNLVNHVLILNFAQDIAVLQNQFKVINGPAQNINDGETIIAEGGGGSGSRIDEDAGTVSSATATTMQDNSKRWPSMIMHPVVAIVRGAGMGQWRYIASRTANNLTVDRAWDVVPQAGSRYAIFNWGARSWLVQGNTLEGNRRGITLYQNATTDLAIVNNTLTNSGSIDFTPWQMENIDGKVPQEFLPVYDSQVIGNNVADTDGSNGVFIGVHTVQYVQPRSFGTSVIGFEVRRNTLTAHQPNVPAVVDSNFPEGYINGVHFQPGASNYIDEQTPGVLGSIFQDNTAVNCDKAIYLNSTSYNTLVCNMHLVNSPILLGDTRFDGVSHASVGTSTCPEVAGSTGALPPIADPKTNPIIPRSVSETQLMALTGSDPDPRGKVVGFNLRTLPLANQGTVYLNGTLAKPNVWVPANQANKLSFQPTTAYVGNVVFTYTATNNRSLVSTAASFTVPVANPLAVELVQFDVKAQKPNALLTWRTASEKNSEYFAVERSVDATLFKEVGTVRSQGSAASYQFVDKEVGSKFSGTVYYRLRELDSDGTSTYSPVKTVLFAASSSEIQIYPNPAVNELRVQLLSAGAHLTVFSITGQTLLEVDTETIDFLIDISSLMAGTYSVQIQPSKGPLIHKFFTKQLL